MPLSYSDVADWPRATLLGVTFRKLGFWCHRRSGLVRGAFSLLHLTVQLKFFGCALFLAFRRPSSQAVCVAIEMVESLDGFPHPRDHSDTDY